MKTFIKFVEDMGQVGMGTSGALQMNPGGMNALNMGQQSSTGMNSMMNTNPAMRKQQILRQLTQLQQFMSGGGAGNANVAMAFKTLMQNVQQIN